MKALTKKESKSKRLNDIIEAAVDEFTARGFEQASMQSIAARAGLTKGGVYHYFGSKDEILLAATEKFTQPVLDLMDAAMGRETAQERLRFFITEYLRHWESHPRELVFFTLTLVKVLSDKSLHPLMRDYTRSMIGFFSHIYQTGMDANEFEPGDALAAAGALMGALDGIACYMILDSGMGSELIAGWFVNVFVDKYIPRK